MSLLILTDDELIELTRRRQAGAQCRALERMGIIYVRDPGDGHPRVLRALVERMLGGSPIKTRPEPELRF